MKLSKENVPFTMVANAVLVRKDLSLKAKGLFAYLFSKPDTWDFAAERIAAECEEERKAIQRVLGELEKAKLLKRTKLPSGRMEYRISFSESEQPIGAASLFGEGKPMAVTTVGQARKIIASIKEKIGDQPEPPTLLVPEEMIPGAVVNRLIELFKPMNPTYERLFRNKAQRAALERLLDKHGVKKIEGAIAAAQACYGKAYCPTITTPVELEAKMGQLVAAVHKSRKVPAGMVSL